MTQEATAPRSRKLILPLFLSAIVMGCSVYANLSFSVTDGANYRYFPPFRPYADFNMNDHLGAEYFNVARSLTAGEGFADPFEEQTGPTAWMPPVFPCILAGLLWLCAGDPQAVMIVLIVIQVLVLIGTGFLVVALARRTVPRLWAGFAAAFFVIAFASDFFLWFQFTHDIWLVLLALDLVIIGCCWLRPLDRTTSAAGWGLLGGVCALVNPIVAFVWGVLSVLIAIRERAWLRLATAVLLAGLVILPWTVRNYLVFGRVIPIKSNLGYELYQSQCLTADGLLERDTFYSHPYTAPNPERQEYKTLGESAYLDRKNEQFWQSVQARPRDFLSRVANRFVAATLWYEPFDRIEEWQIPDWVRLRRWIYPLPFLALVFLVVTSCWQRLSAAQWSVIAVYVVYLIPYIAVSYYDRYAVPLLAAKVVLVFWAADRVLSLLPGRQHAVARINRVHRETCAAAKAYLSVVIPVYNERPTIVEILRRVRAVGIDKEIILVDDGSTDGTRDLLQSMEKEPDVRILYHPENRGKGAALKTGFLEARGDIVIVQDADLEYDPCDYARLIEPILRNQADVVYGSRFLNGAERGRRAWHHLGNRVLTTVSNLFTRIHLTDMETGYKVFRREIVQSLAPRLKQNRFGIEPELTAKVARGGYRVQEVGIHYQARTYKEGKKIGWRDGLQALWCCLRYWRWD